LRQQAHSSVHPPLELPCSEAPDVHVELVESRIVAVTSERLPPRTRAGRREARSSTRPGGNLFIS
jgi:hypothetical protein